MSAEIIDFGAERQKRLDDLAPDDERRLDALTPDWRTWPKADAREIAFLLSQATPIKPDGGTA